MILTKALKTSSCLHDETYEIINQLSDSPQTFIITDKNKPVAVLQDIYSYERIQESLSMLKIIAQSNQSLKNGNYKPISQSFRNIRDKISETKQI